MKYERFSIFRTNTGDLNGGIEELKNNAMHKSRAK